MSNHNRINSNIFVFQQKQTVKIIHHFRILLHFVPYKVYYYNYIVFRKSGWPTIVWGIKNDPWLCYHMLWSLDCLPIMSPRIKKRRAVLPHAIHPSSAKLTIIVILVMRTIHLSLEILHMFICGLEIGFSSLCLRHGLCHFLSFSYFLIFLYIFP